MQERNLQQALAPIDRWLAALDQLKVGRICCCCQARWQKQSLFCQRQACKCSGAPFSYLLCGAQARGASMHSLMFASHDSHARSAPR